MRKGMRMALLLISCVLFANSTYAAPAVRDGDIIFHTSRSAQSAAIQRATHSPYSHVGIILYRDDKPFVFEAIATVRYTPLADWIARGDGGRYVVKRLARQLTPEQAARMRREQVCRIAALREHADVLWLEAQVLFAAPADLAFAAAHPRIDEAHVANRDAGRIGADGHDLADVLVPHRKRQLDAAVGESQLLAAADFVVAIPDMEIGMADAGGQYLEKHLRALRRGGVLFSPSQRRAAFANLEAVHFHFVQFE